MKQTFFRVSAFTVGVVISCGVGALLVTQIPTRTNNVACTLEVGTITGQLESVETRGATYVRYRGADEWYLMLYVGEC